MPRKLIKSISFARAGAKHSLSTQRNLWIHLLIGAAVMMAGYYFALSLAEMALLVLTIVVVVVTEMLNTAIEEMVNLVKPDHHPQAGLVKNIAAAAVLMAAVGSVIIGLIIFLPRMIRC